MEKMYTVKEAANYLGLSERTIREKYIPNGKIKAVKYDSSDKAPWMIAESEIKRLQKGI